MLRKLTKKLNIRHRLPLVGILCLLVIYTSAQSYVANGLNNQLLASNISISDTIKSKKKSGEPKLIKLMYAAQMKRSKTIEELKDIVVFVDSVCFLHEGAYLYCDSAHVNESKNTFEAFENVRLEQGDTLFLYGDYMFYNGNTKLAQVRHDVKMDHRSGTLFTDSLDYDRAKNVAYYFDGGMLVDSLNELTSFYGQYEPNKSLATFTDEVVLNNPNFKLYSDTLLYSTNTRIANIVSPSRIESDSGTILSSRGWYNTITDRSLLLDQSTVTNKDGDRILKGDSILYYRAENSGEVFGNMFLQDTTKRVIMTGHYGFYNGKTDYTFATDSASAIEYSQGDSLYLHADTLEMIKLAPEEVLIVSMRRDTVHYFDVDENPLDSLILHTDTVREIQTHHQMKGYYGVRFYRSDMQGVCDSLQFNSSDSILHMYKDPILWNLDRQLTGDTIHMFLNDSTIDRMYVTGFAFSIEQKDSIHFNQLKSRMLQFHFNGGQLQRVFAEGNVHTIAYPEEKDGTLNNLLNWLESSYLEILLEEGQFTRLKAWPKPVGKTTPFHLVKSEQLRLENFFWYDYMRPLDKDDIFRKEKRKAADKRPPRATYWDRESNSEYNVIE